MTTNATTRGYSLQNAQEFGWNSLTGELLPERRWLLDTYVVGSTVLDAGCGGGGFVDYLCKRGFDATGLERHAMFLGVAAQRGFSGSFVNADLAMPLPFVDGAFDTTVCLDVLEHVSDDQAAIRELARDTPPARGGRSPAGHVDAFMSGTRATARRAVLVGGDRTTIPRGLRSGRSAPPCALAF